jgi:pilus assembly protein CpaF
MSLLDRVRTKGDPEPEPDSGTPAQTDNKPKVRQAAPATAAPAPMPAVPVAPSRLAAALAAAKTAESPVAVPAQTPGWRERAQRPRESQVTGLELRVWHHPQYAMIKGKVTKALLEEFTDVGQAPRERLVVKIGELCNSVLEELGISITRSDRQRMVEQLISDVLGLGPLEMMLKDPEISEIMINGADDVYVERLGRIYRYPAKFDSDDHLMQIIDRIVSSIGRRVDESSPMVDARLKDGSRVNVIIPPLSLHGPVVTIRRFSKDPYTIEDLIAFGTLTADMASFLKACVRARLNILISGGTGSGKTTTLNVLSGWIPNDERIITIEDAAELQLRQAHVITLESRPSNIEGRGRVTIRDLVSNSLRMRPDRIVVGEVRGGEALDMLQAMNTGHDGSLTTVHANSPSDSLARLETQVLMAGVELPSRAIREQIAAAINLVVQEARLRDGTRRIVAISEVRGFDGDKVQLADIFQFIQRGLDDEGMVRGEFEPREAPKCLEELATAGETVDRSMFAPSPKSKASAAETAA